MSGRDRGRPPSRRSERDDVRQRTAARREPARFQVGDRITIVHAKPWKRTITMRGNVTSWDGTLLVLERQFIGGGRYDSLNLPKLTGDWGTIEVVRGGWVLRRAYYRQDHALIGELFNIQTPAEIDARGVYYVDLEIDVMRLAGGSVSVVDEDDLAAAVRIGGISAELAVTATDLAYRLAELLRTGGDWQTADSQLLQG